MPCNTDDFELNYSIVWAASKSRCFVQLCSPGCGDLFSLSRGVRVACGAELWPREVLCLLAAHSRSDLAPHVHEALYSCGIRI